MISRRRMCFIGAGIVLLLSACDRGQIFHKLRPDSVVLAFGGSLTFGIGAQEGWSYPAHLEKLIARKVVNAGVDGEVSGDGAKRLPGLLADHEPDLVILGHGAGEMRRNGDRRELQNNLRRMFEAANRRGIPVVMIAVSDAGMEADGTDLYQELAREHEIPLVHATLGDLLTDRDKEDDAINRNADAYRRLAEAIAGKLYELRAI